MDFFIIVTLIVTFQSVMFSNLNGLALLGVLLETLLFTLLVLIAAGVVSYWKIFKKAGEEGWKSLIPFYNMYTLVLISGNPTYLFLFFFVPILNIYALARTYIDLANLFGKDASFGVGIFFFPIIFPLILAFGKAEYQGGAQSSDASDEFHTEGFSTSNQSEVSEKPAPKIQPKPEDPWVTGKE